MNMAAQHMSWHAVAWATLTQRAERGTLPHALLLAGPAGLGKRAFAERFVRARLCAQPRDGEACGACRACALLDAGTHPDRIGIAIEENPNTGKLRNEIVVEQIRALSARLAMASQFGGWQVATIDPADAMNAASANALLKTLEEPTAASLIVLVADQAWRLTATIRSRCQRIDFALPPRADALAWLRAQGVADAEGALDAAGGNPGRAAEFAGNDELQRRADVSRDLRALAGGRAQAHELARAWAADEPRTRLEHAARLFAAAIRKRADGHDARGAWSDSTLLDAYDRANRLRELLRAPLRAEPALVEWLTALQRGAA